MVDKFNGNQEKETDRMNILNLTRGLLPLLALIASGALAQPAEPRLRPPATPLVACDPYFSIWSPGDKLTDVNTTHWTGRAHRLFSTVSIDGKTYRVMGAARQGEPALAQKSLTVLPTRTIYTFEEAGIALTLTFMTPMLPGEIDLISRPVTYLTYEFRAIDGNPHEVDFSFDASAELTVDFPRQPVTWSTEAIGPLTALKMGSQKQNILGKKGDDLRIDWGYLYVAARTADLAGATIGGADSQPAPAEQVAAALVFKIGKVSKKPVARWLLLAYDDLYSIQYMKENLRPYWRRNGWEAADLLKASAKEYGALAKRCAAFDDELMADLTQAGGSKYAQICALAYRQCFAGGKFVADKNGQPLQFPKENHSNGCISTSDVLYPMSPQFLLFGPTVTKSCLVPFMNYAASERWKFPFAPHDLGVYPQANGQVYGGGERTEDNQMPVEESGNLLILFAALAQMEGNADFAGLYWPQLERWAEYLKSKGFDPENQLCTDDFAGHLAHNVNLSAKAICGLGAFSRLCEMRGDQAKAAEYQKLAREFAAKWVKEAADGDHSRLTYDRPNTWSQKYNLVWDRVLGLNLFPPAVLRQEMDYYRKIQNPYGLPLDSRQEYAKVDWTLWSATLTQDRADFEALAEPVYRFINETSDRSPLTDWYQTRTARKCGMTARPVIGGVFMQMLYGKSTWKKHAGRDQTRAKGWAPMPFKPAPVPIPTLANQSKISASYSNPDDTIEAINDGIEPEHSGDLNIPRMTWWTHKGTAEWVQYEFARTATVEAIEVWWFDDRQTNGGCRIPATCQLLWLDGATWTPVAGQSPGGCELDRVNRITFTPVTTRALRLQVKQQDGFGGGVLEWKVQGKPVAGRDYGIVPVPFTAVKLTDAFWAPRLATNRAVTVAHNLREMEKQGTLGGFKLLAGDKTEKYHGYMWGDSDLYKTIEGIGYVLRTDPDPVLEKQLDGMLAPIARSPAGDGFLFPHLQITDPAYKPFARETSGTCESYSMGHLIESAVECDRLLGRPGYLAAARRAADLMVKANQDGRLQISGHPEVELALVKLFRATGRQEYLDLAQRLVEAYKTRISNWSEGKPAMGHDDVLGHAVAMMYLYSGATDVGILKGDTALIEQLERKWERMVGRKMYITGGVGHTQHGEGFAGDYDLPAEQNVYCETCSAIADIFWSSRMFQAKGESKYYDVVERALYNNLAAAAGLGGDRFFYTNPLASDGKAGRWAWHGCPCCPTNLVRFWPRLPEYLFAVGKADLYVNLFAACQATVPMAETGVKLRMQTDYPWDGGVRLEIDPEKPVEFALRVRIPGWAEGRPLPSDLYRYEGAPAEPVALKVNGEKTEIVKEKGYAVVRRQWRAGDRIEITFPMPVRKVVANEKVTALLGRAAVERGPLVYCAESVDNAGKLSSLAIPADAKFRVEKKPGLLNGLCMIQGSGVWKGDGFKEPTQGGFSLVPYYAWNHRGQGDMKVWLGDGEAAVQGPYDTSKWVGTNYTPAYASNQVQLWHDFRPAEIEKELAAARKHFGINTLRVYLHNINYDNEKEVFLKRIDEFIAICAKHGIKPGFTFFDDCWNHAGVTIAPMTPVDGRHNGCWAALQDAERKDENLPKFKAYVQDVVKAHRDDPRVLWWEVYNEPVMKDEFTVKIRTLAYGWAKECKPIQPVIACWDDSPCTDIVNAHGYSRDFAAWDRQADLNPAKGTVFTEAGARWFAPRPSSGSPTEIIHWLRQRQAAGKTVPGVYLCWELMAGNSNCRWYWGTPDKTPEPPIPWCGLLWPDGTPVSLAEAEAIHSYTTGEKQALAFEDFEDLIESKPLPAGWQKFGQAQANNLGVLQLDPGLKLVTGSPEWGDYVVEAAVMLKDNGGNAGLVFRVNKPGPGPDQMLGYYAGFDENTLYLGKMNNNWQTLASYDLKKLGSKVEPGVWNRLRVEAKGNHIKIWLNPLHDDPGLRIDYIDQDNAVLKGAAGTRAFGCQAWFDDFIVLPAK
jgi:DUF1680 family protein